MELEIREDAICTAKVNMKQLRKEVTAGSSIDNAVVKSTTFNTPSKIRLTDALKLLTNNLNWKEILNYTTPADETMNVQYHLVKYKNKTVYLPGSISIDRTRIILKEEKVTGQGIIIMHSILNAAEFAIKEYIDSDTFRYGMPNQKWNVLIEGKDITSEVKQK